MGRGAAAGWDMHVDECESAGGVVARHKDRIGVPDESEVREAFVSVWSSDGEVSLWVVGRNR
jgi:hypothetical protein